MEALLPFIISGIATGAIYGLAGTGLVLTYKTSGLFNFGQGAIATMAAFGFYWMHEELGMNWILALVLNVVVLGIVTGLLMEVVASRLTGQRVTLQVVGTVGLILAVQGGVGLLFGHNTLRMEQFLPGGTEKLRVGGVVIGVDQVIVAVVALLAVLSLYILFRRTRVGVAMRAVVDDPELLAMQGTDPRRVRRFAWIIGSTFTALSGVLIAPLIGLDGLLLTFLVVQAFGAAALGGFSSIPLTFVGGIAIGVASDVSKKFVLDVPWMSGVPAGLPFLILFVVLLVTPRRKLIPVAKVEARPPVQYRSPTRVRIVMAVVLVLILASVPQLVGSSLTYYTTGLATGLLILSLGLLVRLSGQVSLCHAAFAAIGAVAFSQLHVDHGIPWMLSLLLAGLIVVPVGVVIAIPAIRLSGLFLALATLGFGILLQRMFYGQSFMFTEHEQGRIMPKPGFADSPSSYYYVVLAALVAAAIVVVLIQRSRLGRMLQGMSDSPKAVTAMGLSVNTTKVIVFAISAFLAGIAGALLGVERGFAVNGDVFFDSLNSLILLAMLALAPVSEPWFALMGVTAVIPAYVSVEGATDYMNIMFGVFAILLAMQGGPAPMPAKLRAFLDRFATVKKTKESDAGSPLPVAIAEGQGLSVKDLSVRFGGLVAVDGVSFDAPTGRVTGMIGPNGAGKTTTFDACSGLNRRFDGRITFHERDITSLPPAERGRRGLGRTFQRMELCETLTVFDNVCLGRESSQAGRGIFSQLAASSAQQEETKLAAWAAIEMCRIDHLAHVQAGSLSTGQRRLVELARCLAGPFDVLLLDEPSSGLDGAETAQFGRILRRVVEERGIGVLLVEHDMDLVMSICDHIYVLDFGKLIFDGTPSEVASSELVQAAYLGAPEAELNEKTTEGVM
jgi:ABC-type branched-subunit amino acid transport system ATPase component/branched-subunit amino acid ABC-type transport system permease component